MLKHVFLVTAAVSCFVGTAPVWAKPAPAGAQAPRCYDCGDPRPLCKPDSSRACRTTQGCPGREVCLEGTSWGPCTGGGTAGCGCVPGSVTSCQPVAGACGQKTCSPDGSSFGACSQLSCGVCTPGAKQACDYRGSAGTSHCALGEQTCNAFGSGFSACVDPAYRCGTWSSIDPMECALTGIAKYAGVLADIPNGDSKQAYVLNHQATVRGVPMTARAYSSDLWGNAWGTFAVPSSNCFVYNVDYIQTCWSPFAGSTLNVDRSTGRTFRQGTGFPCMGTCIGTNERRVYDAEPRWGNEPFPFWGYGGPGGPDRCGISVSKEVTC
jgi:hypothetical protein